jgi:toxin ParE1/3/4
MSLFRVTPRALADLDAIARWSLRQWGDARTEIYLRDLSTRFGWLAANPLLGRDRADVRAGYRSFPQGRHVVFHVAIPQGIAIIGVPHQAMDVADYLDSDG